MLNTNFITVCALWPDLGGLDQPLVRVTVAGTDEIVDGPVPVVPEVHVLQALVSCILVKGDERGVVPHGDHVGVVGRDWGVNALCPGAW